MLRNAKKEDLEAVYERVRAEKTTPEGRAKMRAFYCEPPFDREHPEVAALLDDFVTLEAELAALRRVEGEGFCADRSRKAPAERAWYLFREGREGRGATLTEALADYDAKKARDAQDDGT